MSRDLGRLLRPRSIAVVGGGAWCANVVEQSRKIGFAGRIAAVHPTRARIGGAPAVVRVADLPFVPDAAFLGINRAATIDAVRDLRGMGAGGAVCFASGFREAQAETGDGADRESALLEAAGEMPILGPNCYGFVNYLDGAALWPDQHGGLRVESGVAIVSQSSNIALNLTMQARGLPLAYVVTVGNQAQSGSAAVAGALLRDPRVTALGLYIEGVGDLRAFEAMAAEAHRLGKPVVALKAGRSDQARAAAVTHTASLAGSDAGGRALLRRLGIGQADTLPVLLETLKLLHVAGPLPSNRIASMSCSGGEACLVADIAHGGGLCFPDLDPRQSAALREALGPRVALANPLDYHTYIWGDEEALTRACSALFDADLAMGCVILDFPRADRCDAAAWEPVISAVARARAETGRALAIVSSLPECLPEAMARRLIEMGIVPLAGFAEAVAAMAIAADLGRARPLPGPLTLPSPEPSGGRTLTEAEAKALLSAAGVAVPRSAGAATPDAAARAATALGFPVVLKAEGIAHKTEAGAVVLNLGGPGAVEAAARAMPGDSFLVEEMIGGAVAELLVGVVQDAAHGFVLTLAAGGTLAELLDDRATLLVPSDRAGVAAALDSLRIARQLAGWRGGAAASRDAVLDAVMAVQAYVTAARPLEVEINPLLCCPGAAVAADALIRVVGE